MRWKTSVVAAIVVAAALLALPTRGAQAQPYAGPPTDINISVSIGPTEVSAGATARVLAPPAALLGGGAIAQSQVSLAVIPLGPDGNPKEGAGTLELEATVSPASGSFKMDLPPTLPLGRYSVYVNESFMGQFDLVSSGATAESGRQWHLTSTRTLIGVVTLVVMLATGTVFAARARGY
ncbi:MAG: hypothetical protein R3C39_14960 [Dehalococcoidia bacterium]